MSSGSILISRTAGFVGSVWMARSRTIRPFPRTGTGAFASNLLRHLFETVVERCMAEWLVGADGFAVDASLIAACQQTALGCER
jgi:hypothetical protein